MLTMKDIHMEKEDNPQVATEDIRIEKINPEDILNETNNIIFFFSNFIR